ncbi:energy transducer TonB [Flavobacterium sp. MFBS3-15]|uniref:energy transducer TonB n=1 Tax=Flavobacterium sp. MFBS3-15 TaxID=2989816 RepID=UPI002236B5A4|nr:energy transducer TonB [Flavobacterium sp. MFBS3-15]MCW4467550.1 energy transducer TonB [Flavobacterium sp. MFBS3-15]
MKYLETENEKKSFAITTVIFVIILILCFFLGMTYFDPPPENGIAINFGTSEFGMGEVQPMENVASAPQTQSASQSVPQTDQVATQDVDDAPVITKKEPQKQTPKETAKPAPKPSQSTEDALNSLINGPKSDGKPIDGQGNTNKPGDQGREDGDRNADGDGDGKGKGKGRGTGVGNYKLTGRKALAMPAPNYTCNEQGTVVVEIAVDKDGNVISATPGARGTTNTASCLYSQAKAAAMKAKFNEGESNKQVGTIVYNFKLTD